MNKKKILIAVIVLLVVIITCCLIKIVFNNSHIETASINTLADNDNGRNINTIANVMEMTTNETIENKTNDVENETIEESNADTKESNTTEKTDNKTTTSQNNSGISTNKTNSKNNNNNVNTSASNKNNSSSSSTKEEQKKEESKPTNTENTENTEDTKENEDAKTEEKEETNTENEKLANTFFSEYNKQKTQEAVNYINEQMKKDEMYEELGGYAVACTTKPTNYWISYSSNSKLNGVALAGCKVSVYVENYYRYNSRGTDYYLYDTKIYLYQEVI